LTLTKLTSFKGVVMQFLLVLAFCLTSACTVFSQDSSVVYKPLTMTSSIEAGDIVNGYDERYRINWAKAQMVTRLGVWLNQEVTINKRLVFKMGVGGMFYNPFPEEPKSQLDYVTQIGPGISQATGIYSFGGDDVANPLFQLQFGYFPFKYNNEATNLGEYLLRSGCYPGYIMGGNWNIIGDAVYRVLGARLSNFLFDKSMQQHLIVSMERDVPPMYDISLTYINDCKIFNKVLDIGAGVDFHHLISANEDKTTPKDKANRYLNGQILEASDGIDQATRFDSLAGSEQYYTFRGIKLMAKACIDPKPLLGLDIFGKEDLKLFGEVAVLGVKDYPFYYDDITKRMPVMFGINIPTFKILDILSVQWEWYGSLFENSIEWPLTLQLPQPPNAPDWGIKNYLDKDSAYTSALSSDGVDTTWRKQWTTLRQYYSSDNWKWSIYAKKSFNKYFALLLQIADDNLRLKVPGGRSNYLPTTRGNDTPFGFFKNQWYFMLRLQYGI
jgi:hypothetical protein